MTCRSIPNEETCLANSRHFTRRPHAAGTAYDLSTAIDFMHLLQKELGIDTPPEDPIFKAGSTESRNSTLSIPTATSPYSWIDTYYPLMSVPLDRSLQVLDTDGHILWEADLEENCDETDPEAGKYHNYVPAFHGYGKDADVTGEVSCHFESDVAADALQKACLCKLWRERSMCRPKLTTSPLILPRTSIPLFLKASILRIKLF